MRIPLVYQEVVLSLLMALTGIQSVAQPCKLTGYIEGLGSKAVVFDYEARGVAHRDTVYAVNGRFAYAPKASDNGQIRLRISPPRYTSFWYEPGTITVTGSIKTPYKLLFKGGAENDAFTNYKQSIEWLYDTQKQGKPDSVVASLAKQERNDIIGFIRQHPSVRTSAFLLYWDTLVHGDSIALCKKLLNGLSAAVQQSAYGKQALHRINIVENQPVAGRKAPNFSLADSTGAFVSLTTFKGKYVLLDFWGHWCGPCLRAFPALKGLHDRYAGNLVLIGIAAEFASDKSQWTHTVKKYNANWIQLSELKADKGDVNDQYNITAFPTYLLLNRDGVVLERALSLEQIEQRLSTLLNR